MKASEILTALRNARAAHKAWVARAEALVMGLPLEKEQVPMLPTDCIFGRWYYGDGMALQKLPGYAELEKPHDDLHRTYMQIFKLLYDEPDVSVIKRWLGHSKKLKAKQLEEAKALLPVLAKLSEQMCQKLEVLDTYVTRIAKQRHLAIEKDLEEQAKSLEDEMKS